MIIDCSVLVGAWAFRKLPYGDARSLREALVRAGIRHAVAGSLDAVLYRNPQEGNEALYRALEGMRDFYTPAVTVDPTYAAWEKDLDAGLKEGCPAVRAYPQYQGWRLVEDRGAALFTACAEQDLPVILTVEIEDPRQRHPLDRPEDWIGGEVRKVVENVPGLRIIVANARADRIREVSLTLGDADRKRVWYDTSAVWGPFMDDLKACCREVGAAQFLFGSHAALKTPEAAVKRVELTDLSEAEKAGIRWENASKAIPRLALP